MTKKPLVSIIIGAYNCAESLSISIKSILEQKYTNWELIICDDCSTDNTYEVACKYANLYKRITVIRNSENMKLAYTLNQCLSVVSGKYVARMDADDVCLPDRLTKQVQILEKHPEYAVVGGGIIPYNEHSEKKPRIPKEIPQVKDLIKDVPFYHPTIMMRKSVYDDLGGYTVEKRTTKGQDMDLWFRFFAKGYKGYNIQSPVLKYHESLEDYKAKRNYDAAWGMVQTRYIGFKLNHIQLYFYTFIFKPVISVTIPRKIMYKLHNRKI